jgi:hypothetical protein
MCMRTSFICKKTPTNTKTKCKLLLSTIQDLTSYLKASLSCHQLQITMLERWIDGLKSKVSNPNTDMNS